MASPRDRHGRGIVPQLSVAENLTMNILERLGSAGMVWPARRDRDVLNAEPGRALSRRKSSLVHGKNVRPSASHPVHDRSQILRELGPSERLADDRKLILCATSRQYVGARCPR